MISHNIKWFLGLSVAVHAVALLGWQLPEYEAGNTGHALLLSITNRAGDAVIQPAATVISDKNVAIDRVLPAQQSDLEQSIAAARIKQQHSTHATVPTSVLPPASALRTTALSAQATPSSSSLIPSR